MLGPGGFAFGPEPWRRLDAWLSAPRGTNIPATIAIIYGFAFTLFLAFMRMNFNWWPFHPVGFATSASWSMDMLWFCMLVAWLIKVVMLKYMGAQSYKPYLPFFIGLVLGDYVVGSIWNITGVLAGVQVYHFWPY
jgi:hypothetical protein